MANYTKNKYAIIIAAMIIPGLGHVIIGKTKRGLIYLFWVILFGLITLQFAAKNASFIGRNAGGIAIWVLSILELNYYMKNKFRKD